jgi:hypothetical protein
MSNVRFNYESPKDLDGLVGVIERGVRSKRRIIFFMGAGCSVTSNVPLATIDVDNCQSVLSRIKQHNATVGAHVGYRDAISLGFPTLPERNDFFKKVCKLAQMSQGYKDFEQVVRRFSPCFNVIFTTNFDRLLSSSLPESYVISSQHDVNGAFNHIQDTPTIVELHGNYLKNTNNTWDELKDLHEGVVRFCSQLLETGSNILVFVGYAGADMNVAQVLGSIAQRSQIETYYVSERVPETNLRELFLNRTVSYWVRDESKGSFDRLMKLLRERLVDF